MVGPPKKFKPLKLNNAFATVSLRMQATKKPRQIALQIKGDKELAAKGDQTADCTFWKLQAATPKGRQAGPERGVEGGEREGG